MLKIDVWGFKVCFNRSTISFHVFIPMCGVVSLSRLLQGTNILYILLMTVLGSVGYFDEI